MFRWYLTGLTPIRFGNFLSYGIQSDTAHVILQFPFRSHSVMWLQMTQQGFRGQKVTGCFGISQLVLDSIQYHDLQGIAGTTEKTMIGFPEFGFVRPHVHVSDHRLRGREHIVSMGPKTSRHDDFFSHKDPRQQWIKRHFSQETRMCHHITRRRKGSKPRDIQFDRIPFSKSFQSYNLIFLCVCCKERSTESSSRFEGLDHQIHFVSRRVVRDDGLFRGCPMQHGDRDIIPILQKSHVSIHLHVPCFPVP
mmetsp:Transcript_30932/g.71293  ORF Transcript_30932/g.71293 Transcript_30932/m.71293 type:complete len:250 (+) Transcript_30932:351-1100(+)